MQFAQFCHEIKAPQDFLQWEQNILQSIYSESEQRVKKKISFIGGFVAELCSRPSSTPISSQEPKGFLQNLKLEVVWTGPILLIVDMKEPLQGTRLFACVVTKLYVGSHGRRFLRWICWPIGISDKLPTTNILLGLNLPKAEGLESN